MRIFVAGGSGAIGRHLVPKLVAEGHTVVATARSPSSLARIRSWGAQATAMDGLDPASVTAAVTAAAPEVIIHQMTALAGATDLRHFDREFAPTNRLRTEGTRYLLDAAARVGARRVLAQGFTGWTNDRQGAAPKDESSPLDRHPAKTMRATLDAIAELEEQVTTASRLEGLVMRYGMFYGSEGSPLLDAVRRRRLPVIGSGGGVWSFIHTVDAAEATVAALERGAAGVYNIVDDDPAPAAEWIPHLARAAGAKPPFHVPSWVGRLAAGEAAVLMMTQTRAVSNVKAKSELGWAPRHASWRAGFSSWANEDALGVRRAAA